MAERTSYREMGEKRLAIREWPKAERPRERMLAQGPEALSDAELLAIVLASGVNGRSAVELARELLHEAGGWRRLDRLSLKRLMQKKGLGLAKAAQVKAALELGKRFAAEGIKGRAAIRGAEDVAQLVGLKMRDLKKEQFRVLYLNAKHQVIAERVIAEGSLTQSLVHPREVFHVAVQEVAAAIILIHNHPSGDPTPSPEDLTLTERLVKAGKTLGIPVLDHIIIGANRSVSLLEKGARHRF